MDIVDFTLPDQNGDMHTLSSYRGKWIVLYFYPKDDTPGCTTEACNFRDSYETLEKQNVVILGISQDSSSSHKKFADKFHLTFPLLSDTDKSVINAYHAWGEKKFMGKSYEGILRTTYLINPDFVIEKVYEQVNPTVHAKEILDYLKTKKA